MTKTAEHIQYLRKALTNREPSVIENPDLLRAAVLVPVIQTNGHLELLMTVRSENVEHHKGQIAFPGGSVESQDDSLADTALRESEEEINLPRRAVEVIGRLDDVWSPAGFSIAPVVGYLKRMPVLKAYPAEVSEYFTVPLDFLIEDANGYSKPFSRGGKEIDVWFYDYNGYTIWGVTAFIVRNLKSVLEKS